MADLIDRQAAIDALADYIHNVDMVIGTGHLTEYDCKDAATSVLADLPSAESERDTPKRVLWTGWKGYRLTRYNCPNCKKPVRNDDVYCHRCGQRLMFPKVSHTPYVEGQKQEVIVRWDDE